MVRYIFSHEKLQKEIFQYNFFLGGKTFGLAAKLESSVPHVPRQVTNGVGNTSYLKMYRVAQTVIVQSHSAIPQDG